MASVHEVIEAFRQAPTNVERGTKFEQLMVRYFELDPMLSQQYDKVWRWIDWPGRDGKPDTGIDLVARERDTGEYTAIQCKFYEPNHYLQKGDLDSFFTASGKSPFTNRVIISTTNKWGKHAEDALDGQTIPVQRISLDDLAESAIDWDIAWPQGELQVDLSPSTPYTLRPHQQEALEAVFRGFAEGNDRGKLIMACGTGKTFTSLKIAEQTALDNGGRARILFAVPSIALLSQTLREWTARAELDIRAFAVCSDTKVSRAAEDYDTSDVAIPVTTNPEQLAEKMSHRKRAAGMTVVFTTYQSLPAVSKAQSLGVDTFDLVICDEAHRTTGVTLAGEDASNFVAVHDPDFLKASRRLYMTATPRLFNDETKDKAEEHSAEIASMDDLETYGPEFHRLSFGEAVDRGLLTDYKVLVLTVDESVMASRLQSDLADAGELKLDDASKLVGCWNGLAKRAGTSPTGEGFAPGEPPMRRAVAFARDIKSSKQVAEMLPRVVESYQDLLRDIEDDGVDVSDTNRSLNCSVHHVDGTFNALKRNEELTWLKAEPDDNECRILTNARCLSEGVDVPALDAVLFLHPRNSVVDVVQSVGRVMRKSPGKDYGYIILPVAVPEGVKPSEALNDNRRFKTVWQVLNALRAHDDRFNAMVNSIALNSKTRDKTGQGVDQLLGGHVGPAEDSTNSGGTGSDAGSDGSGDAEQTKQMALFSLSEWTEAIYTKIVDKVGTRTYWEDWAADVADIAAAQITRINATLANADTELTRGFDDFVDGLRANLNESISRDDAISMLSQHLITKPVFDALFEGHDFAAQNPVSKVMQTMVDQLASANLDAETAKLDSFYDSVRVRASEVTSAEGKQQVIAELYEKFFKLGFAKQADALGIVYTPVEIVDFILRATDQALRDSFGRGLTDQDVHILDGFTGTGTFITRLLQSGLIQPADLARKYASEIHANELMLLAYYIAAVNIETTYHAIAGHTDTADYEPFPGIVLADTFQIHEQGDELDLKVFPANNDRITRQLETPINVIVGNPPYSVGQGSANDLNANVKYPHLDSRISSSYAARSTATNKNSLYDSYLRAFRWATDRIGDQGVVAFVSNGGWIDGNTADGIRLSLADEYSHIYVFNLRGNMRKSNWKEEGGQIFGAGSQATIAIWIGVKNPAHSGPCAISYRDIGDYLTREEKLRIIADANLSSIAWSNIIPNSHGDWIGQRDDTFATWPAIGAKKREPGQVTVFTAHSRGLSTGRDAWCYNYSSEELGHNIENLLDQYRTVKTEFEQHSRGASKLTDENLTRYLGDNPHHTAGGKISWNHSLRQQVLRRTQLEWRDEFVYPSTYRPFSPQWAYVDSRLNDRLYQLRSIFPTPHHTNIGFYQVGNGSAVPFSVLMLNSLPDLHVTGAGSGGQFFPRWTYKKVDAADGGFNLANDTEVDEYGYRRVDNITDEILEIYREDVGPQVSKDDIFYYVYGQLHDPHYRIDYAADLKKMLPHIPTPETRDRFETVARVGRMLADLHMNYEKVEPYPVKVELKKGASAEDRETWRVSKMKWGRIRDEETGKLVNDPTTIIYNSKVTITGIPPEADDYMLGSRSALGWIIDRWQVKTDKPSGIVNDPNDWCDELGDPKYIVDLIARVITVATETTKLVVSLTTEDSQ
ncbi:MULTISPECIES: DEAD/DEAH box helicase [unclassified Dietzia]|uniref:DEAD/DEAH box helicase n=1 Tax=unclassified Dietzia TaxID=2617939 RepID=UPI0012E712B2|nr:MULTISPECIES: DEAD/DEAH box helicase [unclassified Dietzia]MBB1023029.1 DEAD/DEAH box helicase [Dietzia sp. DQ12-76]MBB1026981.1 DEAD/DEAH box helicase [Dietzia sp. DQ11-38-2]